MTQRSRSNRDVKVSEEIERTTARPPPPPNIFRSDHLLSQNNHVLLQSRSLGKSEAERREKAYETMRRSGGWWNAADWGHSAHGDAWYHQIPNDITFLPSHHHHHQVVFAAFFCFSGKEGEKVTLSGIVLSYFIYFRFSPFHPQTWVLLVNLGQECGMEKI